MVRARGAWLGAALALAACGPDEGEVPLVRTERCTEDCDAGPPDGGLDAGPVIPDAPLEDWDTTDAGPLSGIFAVEVVVAAKVVVDVEARQLYRIRILQRGEQTRLKTTPCRVDLPTVMGVAELTIPPALERVVQSKSVEHEGPFLSAPEPVDATFAPPPAWTVLGAELDDPASDPLPTMADPTDAIDEDEDGNPGVTIDAEAVVCRDPQRAFIALRTAAALDGTVDDLDAIEGSVEPTLDFEILGVTDDCLAAAAELAIETRDGSRFRALRVGADEDIDENGNVSCPEINVAAAELFGEHWAP